MFKEMITVLILALLCVKSSSAELAEVMEIACIEEEHCDFYETKNINSTCKQGVCHCYNNKTHEVTVCRPNVLRTNNIIGGHCPCNSPHSECHPKNNLCFCKVAYIPSKDWRRCIPERVPLGGTCETDDQCLSSTLFSHCGKTKTCDCDDGFHKFKQTYCLAQTKLKPKCDENLKCDPNKVCLSDVGECVCKPGFVSANNSENCLPAQNLNENCNTTTQCQAVAGPGALCVNDTCECKEGYLVVIKKSAAHNGIVTMRNICERIVQLGAYCTMDEHCKNGETQEQDDLMICDHGECVCRYGLKNQTPCSTSAGIRVQMNKIIFCILFALTKWKI